MGFSAMLSCCSRCCFAFSYRLSHGEDGCYRKRDGQVGKRGGLLAGEVTGMGIETAWESKVLEGLGQGLGFKEVGGKAIHTKAKGEANRQEGKGGVGWMEGREKKEKRNGRDNWVLLMGT
jgi:hypothetical protein